MPKNNNHKLIALALFVVVLPWFYELLFLVVPPWRLSLASYVIPSFGEYYASFFLIILFLLIAYGSATFSSRVLIPCKDNNFFLASKAILKGCKFLLPLFILLSFLFLGFHLQNGLFQTLLAFRFNELSIGYHGYFILYYFPLALAVTLPTNKRIVNLFCILLIAFTNLLTGYRTLLISSALVVIIYNYSYFNRLSRSFKFFSIVSLVVLFLSYGTFRSGLELGGTVDLGSSKTFVDGLNRSYPMRYLTLIFRGDDVSATFADLFNILISPIWVLVQKYFGTYDPFDSTIVSERLVGSYLVWRGTPDSLATGFSIHIVPFSMLFGGLIGLIFFAILIGASIGFGIRLSRFQGVLPRLLGAFLVTFALSCSESFVSGYGALLYRLVFLLILVCFSAFSFRPLTR